MLRSYLQIALRSLLRQKLYSVINVAGLAVGIAACLLILLFVRDELSFDRHNDRADDIYRVVIWEEIPVTPTIVAPLFRRTFPEVEAAVRLYPLGEFQPVVVRHGDRSFQEEGFYYADSTLFDVFTLPLVKGDPRTALARPNTLVLTRAAARRYFGDADPVGRQLQVGTRGDFEVTGVIEEVPAASHVRFEFVGSFASLHWAESEMWGSANFLTYLRLRDRPALASLRQKIPGMLADVRRRDPGQLSAEFSLTLQPLRDIYLRHEGHIRYVYLFSTIAGLILLIACINYMNLATARSARRAREVGIRKMAGAGRGQLMRQFYGESALLAGLSLGFAWLLAELLLPTFNALSGKRLSLDLFGDPFAALVLVGVGAFVTLVAGSYPALLLSSFTPVRVLKGTFRSSPLGARFRQGLVVFQFAISVFLIVGTAVVYRQLRYVQTKDLGFDREQVLVLPIGDARLRESHGALRDALLRNPNVRSASAVNSIPGYQRGGYGLIAEGLELPEGEYFPIGGVPADRHVVETLGLELVAGGGFPQSDAYVPEPGRYAYIANEATLRALGWKPEEAIGRRMGVSEGRMGTLVGVVKDWHYASLHAPIQPLVLFIEPEAYDHLLVKIAPGDVRATLRTIREAWAQHAPHRPFEYRFLDEELDALYRAEQRVGRIFGAFAALAILIACLGLFGLASYAAEQRTKEIGVRKVMGASVPQIVLLMSKDFTRLVLAAFVLTVPVAYWAMSRWLEDFAYHTEIGAGTFALAGVIALAIAWITVSYQSIRAAGTDVVKALRYE